MKTNFVHQQGREEGAPTTSTADELELWQMGCVGFVFHRRVFEVVDKHAVD
jgi:hypothetical protein